MSNDLIPVSDVERMAIAVAKSGLFGMKTADQALALMLISQAEGRHPALAARDYDIIQGRPAKKTEAMLRDFLFAGGKVEWHALDDTQAEATFSHPLGGTVRIGWDIARATTAGLGGKDMWKKYPRQMLRSRCVSEGIRTTYPAATSGMYVPEEVNDIANQARDSKSTRVRQVLESTQVSDVDLETGEVIAGEVEKDPDAIIRCLDAAENLEELDEAAGWAKDLKDETARTRARVAYKRRRLLLAAAHTEE